jgi:DNA polymerase I-like protein with 3'-5' exonuclease and polymerase domains
VGYTQSPLHSELSSKQKKLIDDLRSCVSKTGINLEINPSLIRRGDPLAVDVEHDELGNLVGIGYYDGVRAVYYTEITPDLIETLIHSPLIAHNGVSDIDCLQIWGINVRDEQLIWDTMLMGHIIDSSQKDYSLKGMAKRELGIIYPSYDDIVGKRGLKAERITLDQQPVELVAKYNALDVYCTWKLYERQKNHS